MLFLKPFEDWTKPVEFSLDELKKMKSEVQTLIDTSKKQIQNYYSNYDLYVNWIALKPKLKNVDHLRIMLWKYDRPILRILYLKKIRETKSELKVAEEFNKTLKDPILGDYSSNPEWLADSLAWTTKERWDIDSTGIFTFCERDKLMEREAGKQWMIENELSRLEQYYHLILEELTRRTHQS